MVKEKDGGLNREESKVGDTLHWDDHRNSEPLGSQPRFAFYT